jgi:addiction module HigA family antidote
VTDDRQADCFEMFDEADPFKPGEAVRQTPGQSQVRVQIPRHSARAQRPARNADLAVRFMRVQPIGEDLLPEAGLSVTAAAKALGVSRQMVHDILAGRKPLSAVMCLKVSRLFGSAPEFWMRLPAEFDLRKPAQNKQVMERVARIVPVKPLKEVHARFPRRSEVKATARRTVGHSRGRQTYRELPARGWCREEPPSSLELRSGRPECYAGTKSRMENPHADGFSRG